MRVRMSKPVVSAHALSKTYRVFNRPIDRLVEALFRKSLHTPFHALSDVSFEVQRGEGLGIIGENVGRTCAFLAKEHGASRVLFGGGCLRGNDYLSNLLRGMCLAVGLDALVLDKGEYTGALGALALADVARRNRPARSGRGCARRRWSGWPRAGASSRSRC